MTPKQTLFVQEYLIDLNATQAAIRAGFSERTAYSQGQRLLKDVEVAQALARAMDKRAEKTEITAERVLQELWAIATADPNELIQFRRGACKHCHGGEPVDEHLEPQPHGGALTRSVAVNPRIREPDPDCTECGGEGYGRAYAADTRTLTETAKRLYAGVKVTKDGFEIKMHDKAAALVNVGRHLGMFKDKTELSGPDGQPFQIIINKPA